MSYIQIMTRDQSTSPQGVKTFLYSGPASRRRDSLEEETFDFQPKAKEEPARHSKISGVNLDDVWSIKKNVNVKLGGTQSLQENTSVNKQFYSRYGGFKDRNERDVAFDFGALSPPTDSSRSSWSTNRRAFSYANSSSLLRNSPRTPSTSNVPGGPLATSPLASPSSSQQLDNRLYGMPTDNRNINTSSVSNKGTGIAGASFAAHSSLPQSRFSGIADNTRPSNHSMNSRHTHRETFGQANRKSFF